MWLAMINMVCFWNLARAWGRLGLVAGSLGASGLLNYDPSIALFLVPQILVRGPVRAPITTGEHMNKLG